MVLSLGGDECLKKITKQMQCVLMRSTDFCARYGGEEFTVILPDTNLVDGKNVLEVIRQSIEKLVIKHEFSSVASVVTVSIGFVVEVITIDSCVAERSLLARADHAL
jgi:diguanylate cyclase (GGDEF)-like protein